MERLQSQRPAGSRDRTPLARQAEGPGERFGGPRRPGRGQREAPRSDSRGASSRRPFFGTAPGRGRKQFGSSQGLRSRQDLHQENDQVARSQFFAGSPKTPLGAILLGQFRTSRSRRAIFPEGRPREQKRRRVLRTTSPVLTPYYSLSKLYSLCSTSEECFAPRVLRTILTSGY